MGTCRTSVEGEAVASSKLHKLWMSILTHVCLRILLLLLLRAGVRSLVRSLQVSGAHLQEAGQALC